MDVDVDVHVDADVNTCMCTHERYTGIHLFLIYAWHMALFKIRVPFRRPQEETMVLRTADVEPRQEEPSLPNKA